MQTKCKVKSLSRVRLFATPWTAACQAPPSMGFSRQVCWSGFSFPSPGDVPDSRIESGSPALQTDALLSELRDNMCTNPRYILISMWILCFLQILKIPLWYSELMAFKDVYTLLPGAREYVTLCGERDLADVIKVRNTEVFLDYQET